MRRAHTSISTVYARISNRVDAARLILQQRLRILPLNTAVFIFLASEKLRMRAAAAGCAIFTLLNCRRAARKRKSNAEIQDIRRGGCGITRRRGSAGGACLCRACGSGGNDRARVRASNRCALAPSSPAASPLAPPSLARALLLRLSPAVLPSLLSSALLCADPVLLRPRLSSSPPLSLVTLRALARPGRNRRKRKPPQVCPRRFFLLSARRARGTHASQNQQPWWKISVSSR